MLAPASVASLVAAPSNASAIASTTALPVRMLPWQQKMIPSEVTEENPPAQSMHSPPV